MLTIKQIKVIENAWKKGNFYIWDLNKVYTCAKSKHDCIRHLLAMKIISRENMTYVIDREMYSKFIEGAEQKVLFGEEDGQH